MGRLNAGEFYPHRSVNPEDRIRHIETFLAEFGGRLPLTGTQPAPTSPVGTVITGNSGGGVTLPIPEASVVFDPSFGHSHDGANSHTVPLTGDATGTNAAVVVARIEGKPIPAPAGGDDLKYIRWNNGGNTFEYAAATSGAPLVLPQRTVAANDTYGAADTALWANATTGNIALTLPAASALAGRVLIGKKLDASVNTVTLTPAGADTIDGGVSAVISVQYTALTLVSDGVNKWWLI